MHKQVIQLLDSIPQYMGEGIVGLATIIIAGLIVGYFSSKYFSRISEITRVEGLLFEKKIPIYKEIFSRVELMNQLQSIQGDNIEGILTIINEAGFEIPVTRSYQIAEIFLDFEKMRTTFLDIDQYIAENRLYYDDDVYKQLLIFQNYIIVYVRIYTMYYETVTDFGADKKKINAIAQSMFTALGIVLHDDFAEQTYNVINCIRKSLNNVTLERRKTPRYDNNFFNDNKEFIMSNLLKSSALIQSVKINKLIATFVGLALLAEEEN